MAKIAFLTHDERVRLDPDVLNTLYAELGEAGAENVVSRALEITATRICELRRLFALGAYPELAKLARSLVAIAEQVGMTRFSKVAGDVAWCARVQDEPALAATLARLERLADRSLLAMTDLADLQV